MAVSIEVVGTYTPDRAGTVDLKARAHRLLARRGAQLGSSGSRSWSPRTGTGGRNSSSLIFLLTPDSARAFEPARKELLTAMGLCC